MKGRIIALITIMAGAGAVAFGSVELTGGQSAWAFLILAGGALAGWGGQQGRGTLR